MQIHDGPTTSHQQLEASCGAEVLRTQYSSGNKLTVRFTSDSSIARPGFMGIYAGKQNVIIQYACSWQNIRRKSVYLARKGWVAGFSISRDEPLEHLYPTQYKNFTENNFKYLCHL